MEKKPLSRREAARNLALGAGGTLLGLTNSVTADDGEPDDQRSPVDLQLALLFAKYPSEHFTDKQIDAIRRDLRRRQVQSELLRKYSLDHTDAPALIFAAYRREESIDDNSR